MIANLVRRFVDNESIPLEQGVLDRAIAGEDVQLTPEEIARVNVVSRELGLRDFDAPEDVGGHDLPVVAMVGVNEAIGMAREMLLQQMVARIRLLRIYDVITKFHDGVATHLFGTRA